MNDVYMPHRWRLVRNPDGMPSRHPACSGCGIRADDWSAALANTAAVAIDCRSVQERQKIEADHA